MVSFLLFCSQQELKTLAWKGLQCLKRQKCTAEGGRTGPRCLCEKWNGANILAQEGPAQKIRKGTIAQCSEAKETQIAQSVTICFVSMGHHCVSPAL
jgi:hypothetical protein